jgi:OmpA family/Outer membrane protein beta-barrel domain/Thrombospondin type 3 repeat
MRRPVPLAVLLTLTTLAAPLSAQRLFRLEAGAAGGYYKFGSQLELNSAVGGTVRAGYWFHTPFSVEAEATFSSPTTNTSLEETVSATTIGLWVLDNFRIGLTNTLFLKAGYGRVDFGSCPSVSTPGSGPCGGANMLQAGLGTRISLSPTLFMRYEVELARGSATAGSFSNVSLQGGVSLMIGSKPLIDTDGDGVYDRYDRCADTRLGALVDKHGCPSDQDSDGVPDGLDRCPSTAVGATVDVAGCPEDSDSDGVLDGLDQCPDTPNGALVDSNGCPSDSDSDGVLDGLDRCPATPVGATVDPLGCPGDADGDGVPDGLDKCPDTPYGARIEADGCTSTQPLLAPEDTLATELRWSLPGTVWQFRGAVLAPEAFPVLDSIVATLKVSPGARVEVEGFAQDRLVQSDNTRLSKRRAEVVRGYMVDKGIEVSRITIFGRGSSTLIVADTTEGARIINRRVEIRVTRNP